MKRPTGDAPPFAAVYRYTCPQCNAQPGFRCNYDDDPHHVRVRVSLASMYPQTFTMPDLPSTYTPTGDSNTLF